MQLAEDVRLPASQSLTICAIQAGLTKRAGLAAISRKPSSVPFDTSRGRDPHSNFPPFVSSASASFLEIQESAHLDPMS